MAMVNFRSEIEFEDTNILVFWEQGDIEYGEEGYEIQLSYEDKRGDWHGINCWSFGLGSWSRELSDKWGGYIETKFTECNGDIEKKNQLIEKLEGINCRYVTPLADNEEYGHLKDLEMIKSLLDK